MFPRIRRFLTGLQARLFLALLAQDAAMQQLADKQQQTKEDIESQITQSTAKLLNAVTTVEQHLSQYSQEKRQDLMEDVATCVTNLKSGRKMPGLYLDMQKMQHRFDKTGLENYLRDLKGAGLSPDQILTAAAAFLATRAKIMLLQGSAAAWAAILRPRCEPSFNNSSHAQK